ncbi:MAG: TetR/AcrR family transcriptional regulator [Clostridia bacterium]|nr:TetR/AcrR family transcriptional regulator [Clostridia bacterium]
MQDKQDKKELRRNSIMQAAMELFMENGYQNTKVSDIANKCEIGKGTFYEYFPSKQELLLELLNSSVLEEEISVANAVNKFDTTKEKLAAYINFQSALMKRVGASPIELLQQVQSWGWDSDNAKVFFTGISRIAREYYDTLMGIITCGIKNGELSDIANPHMVATAMGGAITAFVKAHSQVFCRSKCIHTNMGACPEKCEFARETESWSVEEFVDLLCGAYLKQQNS